MNDITPLSELSDAPGTRGAYTVASPRLRAVLARIPNRQAARIRSVFESRGLNTLTELLALSRDELLRRNGIAGMSIEAIENALESFGLHLSGTAMVVRDHATALEANSQRLQQWVEKRMAACEWEMINGDPHTNAIERNRELSIEVAVLTDVMLVLDGREPSTQLGWSTCAEFGCRREAGHEGHHQSSYIKNGFYEVKEWP